MAAVALTTLTLVVLVVGWLMGLLGMPGSWLIVAMAAGHAWLAPKASAPQIAWFTVAALAVIAAVGELLEFLAGAAGVQQVGASRRAKVYAVVGSLIGSLLGAFLGLPIPVVGSLVAAVLFGALGAGLGAAWAEWNRGESGGQTLRVGHAAFWGRVLGTAAKATATTIMVVIVAAALLL